MRAMFKTLDELPEAFRCCTVATRHYETKWAGKIIEVLPSPFEAGHQCSVCGKEVPAGPHFLWINGPVFSISGELVHVDEGQVQ